MVSDGDIQRGVGLVVFDAKKRAPIANAQVALFQSVSIESPEFVAELRDCLAPRNWSATDRNGAAVISH